MDPERLGRLIDEHADALELFARQWCEAPEDVVQEAFLNLARQRRPPENPAAWLFRAVRNGAINAGVKSRRRRRHEVAAAVARPGWFEPESTEAARRSRDGRRRARRAADRPARGDRGPSLGRVDVCANRRHDRRFVEFRASHVPGWPVGLERTVGSPMSQHQVPSDPELTAVAAALGALKPARSRLDRDRVLFQAGQRAGQARWIWPALAASLALLALGEAWALAYRPAPGVVERIVVVHEIAPAPPVLPAPESASVAAVTPPLIAPLPSRFGPPPDRAAGLRWQILRFGLDGLPEPPPLALQTGPRPAGPESPSSGLRLRSEVLSDLLNLGGSS